MENNSVNFNINNNTKIIPSTPKKNKKINFKDNNIIKTFNSIISSFTNYIKDKNEVYVVFINVISFFIIQLFFFHYIVSREYDAILEDKIKKLHFLLSKDKNLLDNYLTFKEKYLQEYEEIVKKKTKERTSINFKLYKEFVIRPIFICIVLFIIVVIIYTFTSKIKLTKVQYLNFLLVFLVYTPELFIYFFIIKKYYYITNTEIVTKIYKNLNIDPNIKL